jgi:hypothetical protein
VYALTQGYIILDHQLTLTMALGPQSRKYPDASAHRHSAKSKEKKWATNVPRKTK